MPAVVATPCSVCRGPRHGPRHRIGGSSRYAMAGRVSVVLGVQVPLCSEKCINALNDELDVPLPGIIGRDRIEEQQIAWIYLNSKIMAIRKKMKL
jgi:hypothetical protein